MSIIPDPGSPPDVEPTSSPIETNGTGYTIAADTAIYMVGFRHVLHGWNDLITNNGIVWLDSGYDGLTNFIDGNRPQIRNNGLIHLRGHSSVELSYGGHDLVNTGSIFSLSEGGWARVLWVDDYYAFVENSGLIVAQSLGLYASTSFGWNAIAIEAAGSVEVINQAGGKILAEAPDLAIAISSGSTAGWPDKPIVTNAGLIEANATGPTGTSIGIYVSNSGYGPAKIVNRGVIRADLAIYATGSVKNSVERIENLAGGVIEGVIALDVGDDTIDNAGTITGYADMGSGADSYTGSGRVEGVVDMGWDDDRFVAGGFDDFATGGRGNDLMSAGGGNDLLTGGTGNDTLEGQSGNDGLIGEWGNDIIGTAGGDYVEGGPGNDRILLGDFTFAAVHGGPGEDTLVMAPGARGFDIGAMTAGGRVSGIEIVELKAEQNLAIRYSDLALLTDGARTLRVDAGASNSIYLAGGWERGANMTIGGETYELWTLQDATVRITEAATVTVGPPPAFGGFDPVTGGQSAPRPSNSVLGYTDPRFFTSSFPLFDVDFTIDDGEIFFSDGTPVFVLSAPHASPSRTLTFTNNGTILSSDDSFPGAWGMQFEFSPNLVNNGVIAVEELAPLGSVFYHPSFGVTMGGGGTLENRGEITVYSVPGSAIAVHNVGGVIRNDGVIAAISENSRAIAVNAAYGTHVLDNTQTFFNSGLIYAEAGGTGSQVYYLGDRFVPETYAATGLMAWGSVTNDGDIIAVLGDEAEGSLTTVGVYVMDIYGDTQNRPEVTNNGWIEGTIAIKFSEDSPHSYDHRVTNNGTLIGDVVFANWADTYNNANGVTDGLVFGMGGNDTLTGGAEGDRFEGGAGDDLLDGNGGLDLASYSTATAGVTVDLRLSGAQATGGGGTDTLLEIENLAGSAFGDSLIGNDGANVISGGAGADGLDGLGGFDILDYRASTSGVSISLAINGASGGHASGDVFANFEGVYGSAHADVLTGSAGDNLLEGGLGNDWLDGGAGFDTAVFSGEGSAHALTIEGGVTHVQGPEGTDILTGIEQLQFANGNYALSQYQAPVLLTATFGAGAAAGGWNSQRVFPRTVADVDGDERPDIVGFGNLGVFVSLTDANGAPQAAYFAMNYFGADPSGGGWSDGRVYPRDLADIDGDGKADLIGFGAAGVYAALATANGGFGQVFLAKGGFGADPSAGGWNDQRVYPRQLADVNGDGMDDIVGFGDGGIHVSLAIGGGSFAEAFLASPGFGAGAGAGGWNNDDVYTRTLADVNGDGRADVIGFGSGGVHIALAGADGHFASPFFAFGGFGAEPGAGGWSNNDLYYRTAADMDGDGLADLVGFGEGGVHVSLALGGGSFAAAYLATPRFGTSPSAGGWTSNDLYPRLLADLDGDGAADIVGFGSAGVEIAIIGSEWMLV